MNATHLSFPYTSVKGHNPVFLKRTFGREVVVKVVSENQKRLGTHLKKCGSFKRET